jgi:hypothetical protein
MKRELVPKSVVKALSFPEMIQRSYQFKRVKASLINLMNHALPVIVSREMVTFMAPYRDRLKN